MKALLVIKKIKYWPEKMIENIILGLIRQEFEVEIIKNHSSRKVNLVIQWHYGDRSLESLKNYKGAFSIMFEKGWFDRDNNFLFYDKNANRFPAIKKNNYFSQFFKLIPDIEDKVWLIMGQMENDVNLKKCNDYNKWVEDIKQNLKKWSSIPVYYRPHPCGDIKPENTLDYDLGRAIGVISWNSSGVLKALMHGIPCCIYDFPELENDCQVGLTEKWVKDVENGMRFENLNLLNDFANQQISIKEFQTFDYKRLMEYK